MSEDEAAKLASPADRSPPLGKLVRPEELRRSLGGMVELGADGFALFDREGRSHVTIAGPDCALSGWEQLPAEGEAASRGIGERCFGIGDTHFEVRPAFAGAERVGVAVFAASEAGKRASLAKFADAMSGVLGALLQAGFATWVTSELHLAASESTHRALEQQNAELERAVEHLRELDKLKSNFLATVSHELRTPLTSVIGFAEMLIQGIAGELNPDQQEYAQTILDRAEDLLRLITQILEMSRMEMGSVHLSVRAVDLVDVVEPTLESLTLQAQRADVRIYHELPEDLPQVGADPDKIRQVLVNLISNAIKFNRSSGEVVVSAGPAPIRRPFEEEDFFGDEVIDAIRISVRDTGIGIRPEQLGRIFEPFYQVDASSTREHGGAGLGLSIVRKLIEAHGGEVWAESTVDVGTTFTFTLPMVRGE